VCCSSAKSANRILGIISRTFVNKNSKTALKLYPSLVRPKLDYCELGDLKNYLRKDLY